MNGNTSDAMRVFYGGVQNVQVPSQYAPVPQAPGAYMENLLRQMNANAFNSSMATVGMIERESLERFKRMRKRLQNKEKIIEKFKKYLDGKLKVPTFNSLYLNENQLLILCLLEFDRKFLYGIPIRAIRYNSGEDISTPIITSIRSIELPAKGYLKSIFTVENGEKTLIWQLELMDEILKDILPSQFMSNGNQYKLLRDMNDIINKETRVVKDELKYTRQYIVDSKKKYEDYLKKEKDLAGLLTSKTETLFTVKDLAREIADIKKNINVDDAYVSKNGNFIIKTKMMYAVDNDTGKVTKKAIGRFIIRVKYPQGRGSNFDIRIENLDYIWIPNIPMSEYNSIPQGTFHPNIAQGMDVCWGDNRNQLYKMLGQGLLFQSVDYMINFLSLFPQDDGASPYVNYDTWLDGKVLIRKAPATVRRRLPNHLLESEGTAPTVIADDEDETEYSHDGRGGGGAIEQF